MASRLGGEYVFYDAKAELSGEVGQRFYGAIENDIRKGFGFEVAEIKRDGKCPGEDDCGLFRFAMQECGDGLEACNPSQGRPCESLSSKPNQSPPCPGENDCVWFQDEKRESGDGNNKCKNCSRRITKPVPGMEKPKAEKNDLLDFFVKRVKWLRSAQKVGGLIVDDITEAEYQGLIFYDATYEIYQTISTGRTRAALEIIAQIPPGLR